MGVCQTTALHPDGEGKDRRCHRRGKFPVGCRGPDCLPGGCLFLGALHSAPPSPASHQRYPPVVLLIDEVDKSDPEFEAFLLEVLSDFQISIPELGTRKASNIPFVFLTSNDSRDMSDALKRRCIHLYIDYPERELELEIVKLKIPQINDQLARRLVDTIRNIRDLDLKKKPCISETLDWAQSLLALQVEDLSPEIVTDTLNVICKYRTDVGQVVEKMDKIMETPKMSKMR